LSYSGILVHARPGDLDVLAARLAALPAVRVHQRDAETGRLVLTLEADTVDDEIQGLRRIQQTEGVVSADLVYHRLAPDAASGSPAPSAGDSS
jgi:nitrate reductase NapD